MVNILGLGFLHLASAALLSEYDLIPPLSLTSSLNYDFGGSTVLHRLGARLTDDTPGQVGYLYSKTYRPMPSKFILDLDFNIEGDSKTLYGDGMALWLLNDHQDQTTLKPGRLMGLDEYYKGTVIAIDTYRNGPGGRVFPRIVLMQNDGTQSYDLDFDGRANELANCGMRHLYNNHRVEHNKLRLAYSAEHKELIGHVLFRQNWEPCFTYHLDLGTVNSLVVSASTGDLSERNLISKIQVTDLTTTDFNEPGFNYVFEDANTANLKISNKKRRRTARKAGMRKVWKLAGLVGVGYGAFMGYKMYKKHKVNKEDRLYKLM